MTSLATPPMETPTVSRRSPGHVALGGVAILGALLLLAWRAPEAPVSPALALAICVALLTALLRQSILVATYTSVAALHFVVAPLLVVDDGVVGTTPNLALAWIMLVAGAGLVFGHARSAEISTATFTDVRFGGAHVAIAFALVAAQALLIVQGSIGYSAQLSTGLTAPTGVMGMLATSATAYVAGVAVVAMLRRRFVPLVVVLIVVEVLCLVATGFRGASVQFLASLFVIWLCVAGGRFLTPKRVAVMAIAVIIGGFAFSAATEVKVDAANSRNSLSAEDFTGDSRLQVIGHRMDLTENFRTSLRFDHPRLSGPLGWPEQAQVVIPRQLWPDKPIMDYGQRVTELIFGPGVRSSSTFSTLGDVTWNVGPWGAGLLAIGLGLALVAIERRSLAPSAGAASVALLVVVAGMVLDHEQPAVLGIVGALRTGLVVWALWVIAGFASASVKESPNGARAKGRSTV